MRGNITQRGADSWRLKIHVGRDPVTRKHRPVFHTCRGTKREANAELARWSAAVDEIKRLARLDRVDPVAVIDAAKRRNLLAVDIPEFIRAKNISLSHILDGRAFQAESSGTLGDFLDRWLKDWAAVNVGAKTLEGYTHHVEKRIKPHIGNKALRELRLIDIEQFYAKLTREGRCDGKGGLAPRTVGHVHRMLHEALGQAVRWGEAQFNAAAEASAPKVNQEEIQILSEDEIRQVLQKLRGRSIYRLVALDLATGMRRGELLAIRWNDILWDKSQIRIVRAVEQTKKHGIRIKETKTKYGRRTISLPASVLAELRALWKEVNEQRLALGFGKAPGDLLVFGHLDGAPRSPRALSKEWDRTVRALKLPDVTFHALRHTHASQLIASGMDVLTISRRLGHSSPKVTLEIYGHLFSNTDDRAAQVIEASFANALSETQRERATENMGGNGASVVPNRTSTH